MKQILVIQNKRIGDVLIASILANNIKTIFPESHITYFVYDYTVGVLEQNPNIDEVILARDKELKKLPELFRTIRKIRKSRYDIILDPYAKFQSRMMCLFSKAPMRIGFKRMHKKLKLPYYTHTVSHLAESSNSWGKTIEDRINMLESVFELPNPKPEYFIKLSKEEQGYTRIQHLDRPVIMLGVLGSSVKKSLPAKYIAQVIDDLTENYKASILFNYAPHQRQAADHIYSLCKHPETIHLDIYEDSIRGFICLMNQCDLLISNEGGSVHIAKALSKPTFTIYSPYIEKSHWNSFEDGYMHDSIHLLEEVPDLFEGYSREARKKIEADPSAMYEKLTPSLILSRLRPYLSNHLKPATYERS